MFNDLSKAGERKHEIVPAILRLLPSNEAPEIVQGDFGVIGAKALYVSSVGRKGSVPDVVRERVINTDGKQSKSLITLVDILKDLQARPPRRLFMTIFHSCIVIVVSFFIVKHHGNQRVFGIMTFLCLAFTPHNYFTKGKPSGGSSELDSPSPDSPSLDSPSYIV